MKGMENWNRLIRFFGWGTAAFLLVITLPKPEWREHRKILHSLLGITLIAAFWLGVFSLFAHVSEMEPDIYAYGLYGIGGLFCGGFLHLVEDSNTRTGINWFFPNQWKIRGGVSTGKFSEFLYMFSVLVCTVAIFFISGLDPVLVVGLTILEIVLLKIIFWPKILWNWASKRDQTGEVIS